ncbi:MAG: hypothetical protein ACI9OJ_001529 [Myxococcota bacterium]|jgi:hypothetical protein
MSNVLKTLIFLLSLCLAGCPDDLPDDESNGGGSDATTTADSGTNDTVGGADVAPIDTCETAAECDDGLACTLDECVAGEHGQVCQWTVQDGTCLINKVCRAAGEAVGCSTCDPNAPLVWTALDAGAACDDDDACTAGDGCTAGVCGGVPTDCDDGDACSMDFCDPATGECQHLQNAAGCDDGDACTTGDVCNPVSGVCAGAVADCDDDNACTDDSCDAASGCVNDANSAPCDLDSDACTADVCAAGACTAGPTADCEDGNSCTLDTCNADVGCYSVPTNTPCCVGDASQCDDGNPCTSDLCDDVTGGCNYENVAIACDDGEVCTVDDACADGACAGVSATCDDGNACTDDACTDGVGCGSTLLNSGDCDDGLACSTGDSCLVGVCEGDTSGCVCIPTFSDVASKIVTLALGSGGVPGQGVDVDGDAETCSPASDCSDGINNSLGVIGSLVNDSITGAVESGSLQLVLEHRDFKSDGTTYNVSLYQVDLAATTPGCVDADAICDYVVSSLYDPSNCTPFVVLPTTITGTKLVGGGKGTTVPFEIPFSETATLQLTLYDVQLLADVTVVDGKIATLNGVLGGAVLKSDLIAAIGQLPADALPLPPEQIVPLLDTLVKSDIDVDGDGTLEAASIGITLQAAPANLTGLAP